MSKLVQKNFQYIYWKTENNGKTVKLCSTIYDTTEEFVHKLQDKKIVIAIGLNPSNITSFNDDVTNLYLRDKIYNEFNVDGYLLTNLCPKVESDSQKIRIGDFDKEHILNIVNLIEILVEKKIVIFFGQTGTKFLNNKKMIEFSQLKELLLREKDKVYYTCCTPNFIHPGHSGQDYDFKPLDDNVLNYTKL